MTKKVTILIPNYRTLKLTKLCLRLLKKHTDLQLIHVIVIDNGSNDDSLKYLKSLNWIELIERPKVAGEKPVQCHSRALDLALERVTTPYVLSIHTDTFVRNSDWLGVLLAEIEKDENVGGVGSWKLEKSPSLYKRLWKYLEFKIRIGMYSVSGKKDKLTRVRRQQSCGYYDIFQANSLKFNDGGTGHYYLRSHCALYRMSLIQKYNLTFNGEDKTAGSHMHWVLSQNNFEMVFLAPHFLSKYMVHLNHATQVLHDEFEITKRTRRKGLQRIKNELKKIHADEILADESLDS